MRNILKNITLALLIGSSVVAHAQQDSLEILNQVKLSEAGMDMVDFQMMACDDWKGAQKFINEDKARFFYINDKTRMLFYLVGSYNEPTIWDDKDYTDNQLSLATNFFKGFAGPEQKLYDIEDIDRLDSYITSFDAIMGMSKEQKLLTYKLHTRLNQFFLYKFGKPLDRTWPEIER